VKKGLLRVLGVVVTLALLFAALPASIASAATVTKLEIKNIEGNSTTNANWNKDEGLKNDKFSVTLNGTTGTYYTLYFSSQQADVGDDIDDEVEIYKEWEGLLHTQPGDSVYIDTLRIPSSLTDGSEDLTSMHGGYYYFYVTEYHPGTDTTAAYSDTRILKSAEFYIHGIATATIDKNNGFVGESVRITGSGFAADENLIVTFGGRNITSEIGNPYVDEDGEFILEFDVPEAVNGIQKVKISGEVSSAEFEFNFTVKASLTITPTSGQAGTTLTFTGNGFDYRNGVIFFINGTALTSNDVVWVLDSTYKRTNNLGTFIVSYVIPATAASGTYTVRAEDEDKNTISAQQTYQVLLNSILTISANTGNVGSAVTVTGNTFSPNTAVNILFDTLTVGTVTTDALGNFSQQITIPNAVCGAHVIKVGTIQQTYTVTPKIVLDKTQGIAGTTVTVTGSGFAGGTAITAKFGTSSVTLNPAVTNATGGFTSSFVVPAAATGIYAVEITAGSTQSANFTIVDASIALNVNTGKVGDTITITGTNFAAGANIILTIDGSAIPGVATITAGTNGAFTAALVIPTIAGGAHTLAVSDGTSTKSAQFTVTAQASLTPPNGNVGSAVMVSGNGFIANATLTIKYNGTAVATGILPLTGAFTNATFTVPASAGGERSVEVTDGTNTILLTFTMETTAPSKPALTLPLSASKEKGIVTFDWNDSTDASLPITYTLQIATDSSFTAIVLNMAGLTSSTYTLTEAQKLSKLPDGGSYYWRVIAKDAANNSVNSDVSTFVVGGGMPGWLMWVWIGIGVVVVFIFAVWLGRRLAYSSY
jgi:hypothetical protein